MWRKSIRCCPLFLRQLSHQLVNHGKAFKSTPAVSVCLRETVKRLEPLPCTVCPADLGKTYLVGVNQALSWIVWHFIDIIWWHLCVRISNGVPERSSDRLGKSINSTPVISSPCFFRLHATIMLHAVHVWGYMLHPVTQAAKKHGVWMMWDGCGGLLFLGSSPVMVIMCSIFRAKNGIFCGTYGKIWENLGLGYGRHLPIYPVSNFFQKLCI